MVDKSPPLRSRLSLLGAALIVVMALGAISAVAAQAAPHWTIEGKEFSGTEKLAETTVIEKVGSEATPLITLSTPVYGYTFTCTALKLKNGEITETSKALAVPRFSGCIVASAPKSCQIRNDGGTPGTIEFAGYAKFELKTIAGATYALMTPASGSLFAELEIEPKVDEGCSISGIWPLSGSIGFLVPTGIKNKPSLSVETSQAIEGASGAALTIFPHEETFPIGKIGLSLASGKNWGVGL
jgi:hypothetical protein